MNHFSKSCAVVAILVSAGLGGCAQNPILTNYGYQPPEPLQELRNQREVSASYDVTWTGLIDHVARTSFTIDQFEKASGLLTLSFGESDIPRYVDCGTWSEDGQSIPYAARTDQGFRLKGRMNIRVQRKSDRSTDVRIDSLYVLRNGNGDVWRFTTSERSTLDIEKSRAPGTTSTRTCQSTHEAERLILTGIEAVAETR